MEERRHARGGLVWPTILIGAGIVFLLNNLGILSWGVWNTLLRLWPVLLIAIGLDILIGRHSILGSLAVAVLLLVVLGAAVWLGVPQWAPSGEALTSETVSQPLEGATSADVRISFSMGSLNINALPQGGTNLVEGQVDLGDGEQITRDAHKAGDTAYFDLRSERAVWMPSWRWNTNKAWDLSLSRAVPMVLRINSGVGQSTMDLSQLNLTDFRLEGGVGQVAVTLPSRGQLSARISGGIGEVTVNIPRGMAARIRVNGGLGDVSVRGDFQRSDSDYSSPGYGSASNRVDLRIDGGIGRVVVRQLSDE